MVTTVLTLASDAKIASNAASIQPRNILTKVIMAEIKVLITTESERTDKEERTYKTTIDLDADINGRVEPIEIIQSDASKVLLTDILAALHDSGYQTVYKEKKASREGGQDRICLQIDWG